MIPVDPSTEAARMNTYFQELEDRQESAIEALRQKDRERARALEQLEEGMDATEFKALLGEPNETYERSSITRIWQYSQGLTIVVRDRGEGWKLVRRENRTQSDLDGYSNPLP